MHEVVVLHLAEVRDPSSERLGDTNVTRERSSFEIGLLDPPQSRKVGQFAFAACFARRILVSSGISRWRRRTDVDVEMQGRWGTRSQQPFAPVDTMAEASPERGRKTTPTPVEAEGIVLRVEFREEAASRVLMKSPCTSSPTLPLKLTFTPSFAKAKAWLRPLPPGRSFVEGIVVVSPGLGKKDIFEGDWGSTKSTLIEPTTAAWLALEISDPNRTIRKKIFNIFVLEREVYAT